MIENLFSLYGRVALMPGGNGKIGRVMALAFRRAGAHAVVTGRNPEKNEAIAQELGDRESVMSLDVYDEEAVQRTMASVVECFGQFDILVNNSGQARLSSVLEQSCEE